MIGRDTSVGKSPLLYHLIFSIAFAVHVVAAAIARFRPAFWLGAPHRSVLSEAREASTIIAQLAFAG